MQTLTINDLPLSEELNSNAMTAIRGGRMKIPGLPRPQVVAPSIIDPTGPWNDFILPSD